MNAFFLALNSFGRNIFTVNEHTKLPEDFLFFIQGNLEDLYTRYNRKHNESTMCRFMK
jgi:hypothetical protein